VHFDPETLSLDYESNHSRFELVFDQEFKVDGQVIITHYPRYDSPYVQGEKKDSTFTFTLNGKSLFLDFENMIRNF
jgi:hypothetical protein